MYYLLEVTYTDKESQALYNTYETETALVGAVETKLGQAMKSEAMKVELLIAFDHTGHIYAQEYHTKDSEIVLSNRLVWITADSEGEQHNIQKYNTALEAEANYHLKRGSAMTGDTTMAILTMIVNSMGVGMKDYWVRPIFVEPEEVIEE